MQSLAWYYRRLGAMSPQEVGARARFLGTEFALRLRLGVSPEAPAVDRAQLPPIRIPSIALDEETQDAADTVLAGRYAVLGIPDPFPFQQWHRDPQTGKEPPLGFGPALNYRDAGRYGNVRNVWEKNRHQHLALLALAGSLSGDRRYPKAIDAALWDWLSENPFPSGINWSSALEVAIRIINWVWIERWCRALPEAAVLDSPSFWTAAHRHLWLLARWTSPGSSANNHLIGEMAGLFIASCAWPVFPESARWQVQAQRILEREMDRQVAPSGMNREQAFAYHLFVAELLLLAAIEGERIGRPFSPAFRDRLKAMLRVLPRVADCAGNLPRFGDGDDAIVLPFGPPETAPLIRLSTLGHAWEDEIPAPPGDPPPGVQALAPHQSSPSSNPGASMGTMESFAFQDVGLYILASNRGGPREWLCLADVGPQGYLSLAAHGHADALSFSLNIGGQPVIVDPGTGTYHFDPELHAYFRSTAAHNTLYIAGKDQAPTGGPFLWLGTADARALEWRPRSDGGELVGEHDGYAAYWPGLKHQRRWKLQGEILKIEDSLLGNRLPPAYEWRLHFHPDCQAVLEPGVCRVAWDAAGIILHLDRRLVWRLARAESNAGWYSPAFNRKAPTWTLIGSAMDPVPRDLMHRLEVDSKR